MKLADSAIDNKVFSLVLTVVILGAGVMAFQGMSRLEDPEFTIKDKYDRSTLPQVLDELRRKVNDAQGDLPPGAVPSLVSDDFGDVYGIFFTV